MKKLLLAFALLVVSLNTQASTELSTDQLAFGALLRDAAKVNLGEHGSLLDFLSKHLLSTETVNSVVTNACESGEFWRLQNCTLIVAHVAKDSELSAEVEVAYFISYKVDLIGGTSASPGIQANLDPESIELTFAE